MLLSPFHDPCLSDHPGARIQRDCLPADHPSLGGTSRSGVRHSSHSTLGMYFHRQAVTVMPSYSILVRLEWRKCQQVRRRGRSPHDPPTITAPLYVSTASLTKQYQAICSSSCELGLVPWRRIAVLQKLQIGARARWPLATGLSLRPYSSAERRYQPIVPTRSTTATSTLPSTVIVPASPR